MGICWSNRANAVKLETTEEGGFMVEKNVGIRFLKM